MKTYHILTAKELPNCPILDYEFNHNIDIEKNKIIFGKCGDKDLFIDVNSGEAVYLSTARHDIFLNSSLNSFVEYINLFNLFLEKLNMDRNHKSKYIQEWKAAMIKIDERAFNDSNYYWGSYVEDYETGMLL